MVYLNLNNAVLRFQEVWASALLGRSYCTLDELDSNLIQVDKCRHET